MGQYLLTTVFSQYDKVATKDQSNKFHAVMRALLDGLYINEIDYFAYDEWSGEACQSLPDKCFLRKPYRIWLDSSKILDSDRKLKLLIKLRKGLFYQWLKEQ
jgi:hypothetical protein